MPWHDQDDDCENTNPHYTRKELSVSLPYLSRGSYLRYSDFVLAFLE